MTETTAGDWVAAAKKQAAPSRARPAASSCPHPIPARADPNSREG